jgi:tetratricopeptide (TPR) repeat protein
LWHEFCHVVTLTKTNNRMPRWLSEGISVYEEVQANQAWGQTMNPQYREMILDGELTPVSKLSGAFLRPPSAMHLQFAYYESSLVVEYLVEKHGLEKTKRILVDLGVGMPISEALERHVGSLDVLDKKFEEFATARANDLAPDVDWAEPDLPRTARAEVLVEWLKEHPKNFTGLQLYAMRLMSAEKWQEAKEPLKKLLDLYPDYSGANNALSLLAIVHRELKETADERKVLEQLAKLDNDAVGTYMRLAELAAADGDWPAVLASAEQTLAVNPLIKPPHEYLAQAADKTGNADKSIAACQALLELEPFDLADAHYRLATQLLQAKRLDEAKRHVLMALEEAPRYREAHKMLLEIDN